MYHVPTFPSLPQNTAESWAYSFGYLDLHVMSPLYCHTMVGVFSSRALQVIVHIRLYILSPDPASTAAINCLWGLGICRHSVCIYPIMFSSCPNITIVKASIWMTYQKHILQYLAQSSPDKNHLHRKYNSRSRSTQPLENLYWLLQSAHLFK